MQAGARSGISAYGTSVCGLLRGIQISRMEKEIKMAGLILAKGKKASDRRYLQEKVLSQEWGKRYWDSSNFLHMGILQLYT